MQCSILLSLSESLERVTPEMWTFLVLEGYVSDLGTLICSLLCFIWSKMAQYISFSVPILHARVSEWCYEKIQKQYHMFYADILFFLFFKFTILRTHLSATLNKITIGVFINKIWSYFIHWCWCQLEIIQIIDWFPWQAVRRNL